MPTSSSASSRSRPCRASQAPRRDRRATARTTRSTTSAGMRAKPDVAARARGRARARGAPRTTRASSPACRAGSAPARSRPSPPSQAATLRARKDAAVERGDLGEVIGHQPHRAADPRVVGEDRRPVRAPPAAARARRAPVRVPVVDGEDRHRRVDAAVAQRQRSADARIAGASAGGRCAAITSLGSMATTWRSRGSYEPVPAPTFTTVPASPSAAWMRARRPGSSWRVLA